MAYVSANLENNSNEIKKLLTYAPLALLYYYLCTGVYLFAFWRSFPVDYISFISPYDIIKSSFALGLDIIFITCASMLGILIYSGLNQKKWGYFIIGVLFFILFLFALYYHLCKRKYLVPFTFLAVIIFLTVIFFIIKQSIISPRIFYSALVLALFTLIFSSFLHGYYNASKINRGVGYKKITEIKSKDSTLNKKYKGYKLIGYLGDKIFIGQDTLVDGEHTNINYVLLSQSEISSISYQRITNDPLRNNSCNCIFKKR